MLFIQYDRSKISTTKYQTIINYTKYQFGDFCDVLLNIHLFLGKMYPIYESIESVGTKLFRLIKIINSLGFSSLQPLSKMHLNYYILGNFNIELYLNLLVFFFKLSIKYK